MNKEIRAGIIDALSKSTGALDDPQLAPKILGGEDVNLIEISTDSLARFEFMMHIEETFDIELDEGDFNDNATLFALEKLIKVRVVEK